MPRPAKITTALTGIAALLCAGSALAGDTDAGVKRYPIPGSDFPIALAVEIPAGKSLVQLSGQVPTPAKPDAAQYSPEYWGDTRAQTIAVMERIKSVLEGMGMEIGDIVKMQAFIVADPAKGGGMDFGGFMEGYTQYFGTEAQPKLPARTTVEVAGLARPGMLVEIEVLAVRP